MINRISYWVETKITNNKYKCIFVALLFALSVCFYLPVRLGGDGEATSYGAWLINWVSTNMEWALSIVSVFVAVWTIEQNAKITEGNLIKELNSEFINNKQLAKVEAKLEKYFAEYRANGNSSEGIQLDIMPEIGKSPRQALVNYLVHLEAVAALVNSKVLRLNVINDLVAYRFFIALNNPVVQKWEIEPYSRKRQISPRLARAERK